MYDFEEEGQDFAYFEVSTSPVFSDRTVVYVSQPEFSLGLVDYAAFSGDFYAIPNTIYYYRAVYFAKWDHPDHYITGPTQAFKAELKAKEADTFESNDPEMWMDWRSATSNEVRYGFLTASTLTRVGRATFLASTGPVKSSTLIEDGSGDYNVILQGQVKVISKDFTYLHWEDGRTISPAIRLPYYAMMRGNQIKESVDLSYFEISEFPDFTDKSVLYASPPNLFLNETWETFTEDPLRWGGVGYEENQIVQIGYSDVDFRAKPGKTYYYRNIYYAGGYDINQYIVGPTLSFKGERVTPPEIAIEVKDISSSQVTLTGRIVNSGGSGIRLSFFQMRDSGSSNWRNVYHSAAAGATSVDHTWPIHPEYQSEYRFGAVNDNGVSYSEVIRISALPKTTVEITELGPTSAVLSGKVVDTGGEAALSQVKFQYQEEGTESWIDAGLQSGTFVHNSSYTFRLEGLDPNKSYRVRSLAKNTRGWNHPAIKEEGIIPELAKAGVAILAKSEDYAQIQARAIFTGRSSTPMNWDVIRAEVQEEGSSEWGIVQISNTSPFNIPAHIPFNGLNPESKYRFRVQVKNARGWSEYSDEAEIPSVPKLETRITEISDTVVEFQGIIMDMGGDPAGILETKFQYAMNDLIFSDESIPWNYSYHWIDAERRISEGVTYGRVEDLNRHYWYYVKAMAMNSRGWNIPSRAYVPAVPVARILPATNYTFDSITLNGTILRSGGDINAVSKVLFQYSQDGINWYDTPVMDAAPIYSHLLDGFTTDPSDESPLVIGLEYYLRTLGYNIRGWGESFNTIRFSLRPTDETKIAEDIERLAITYAEGDSPKEITKNIALPFISYTGNRIEWESDSIYIRANGQIIRPSSLIGNQDVTLTAYIKSGELVGTKTFNVRVLGYGETEDATLKSLRVTSAGEVEHEVIYANDGSLSSYVQLENEIDSISIEVNPTTAGASYKLFMNGSEVPGPIIIGAGVTTITIEITAEDGVTKNSYDLYVFRNIKKATFTDISAPGLYPTYNKMTSEYSINVPNSKTTIEVLFAPETGASYRLATQSMYTKSEENENLYTFSLYEGINRIGINLSSVSEGIQYYTITVFREPSGGGTSLSSLTVDGATLNEEFNTNIYNYTSSVSYNTSNIEVATSPTSYSSGVYINDVYGLSRAVPLVVGENLIVIRVESPNGAVQEYSVTVTRESEDYLTNNKLKALECFAGSLEPQFNPSTYSYTLDVANDVTNAFLRAIPEAFTAKVYINGVLGNEQGFVLNPGNNEFRITVEPQHGNPASYSLIIKRAFDQAENALSSLALQGQLNPSFNPELLEYSVDVHLGVASEVVTAIPLNPDANVFINDLKGMSRHILLNEGNNEISVEVKAPNGVSKTYTLTINRGGLIANRDTSLSSLSLNGALTPDYDSEALVYTADVPYSTQYVSVEALPISELSRVFINNIIGDVQTLDLAIGENILDILVQSESQESRTYRLIINRSSQYTEDENRLQSLKASTGIWNRAFNPDIKEYELSLVGGGNVELTTFPLSDEAKVYINGLERDGLSLTFMGENVDVLIEVEAKNGVRNSYSVNITKALVRNQIEISLSEGQLTPFFDPDILHYMVNLTSQEADITISVNKGNFERVFINKVEATERNIPISNGRNIVSILAQDIDGFQVEYLVVVILPEALVGSSDPVEVTLLQPLSLSFPSSVADPRLMTETSTEGEDEDILAILPLIQVSVESILNGRNVVLESTIGSNTIITAPAQSGWDGTFNLPRLLPVSTVPSADKYVQAVIEMGAGDIPLTLSNAIRLKIPGMAGKALGYMKDGNLIPITRLLAEDNQAYADRELPNGGDGYINIGSDLVIWTKHLTKFVVYTTLAPWTSPDTPPPAEPRPDIITQITTDDDGSQTSTTTIKPVTIVSNNMATGLIDEQTGAELIARVKAAEEGASSSTFTSSIVIDVTTEEGVDETSLEMSISTLASIVSETSATLTIITNTAAITFDQAALATIVAEASGDTVSFTVKEVDQTTLPQEVQETIGDALVFELKVVHANGTVSDFAGGNATVRVRVPGAMIGKDMKVLYIADDGTLTEVTGHTITIDNVEYYEFTTGHFSYYALTVTKAIIDDRILSTIVGVRGYSLSGVTHDMVACYYKGSDTMMPIRMLEGLGVDLEWDEATKTATMSYGQKTVVLTIGSTNAYINGVLTPILGASGALVGPELAPGRTLIPLRFVSEHLGFAVTWDQSNLVTIRLN